MAAANIAAGCGDASRRLVSGFYWWRDPLSPRDPESPNSGIYGWGFGLRVLWLGIFRILGFGAFGAWGASVPKKASPSSSCLLVQDA